MAKTPMEMKDEIPAYIAGTAHDLATHKSTNPYTLPSNGYLRLFANANDPIQYVYLKLGTSTGAISVKDGDYKVVWARKGMSAYTSSTAPAGAYFYPDDSE